MGFAEAMSAPETLWSLVDAGHEVVAFTRRGRRPALRHSRHVRLEEIAAPERDTEAAAADLQKLLARYVEGVLLPLDDSGLWLCSRVQLKPGWRVAGPSGAAADVALDKSVQVDLAGRAGFNVPSTMVARSMDELKDQKLVCPLVLRPALAAMHREKRLVKGRNWICSKDEELQAALKAWDGAWPLMIQPYIKGVGEGIFGLATPAGIRAWSGHRRVRMMNPHGSGSSACMSRAVPEAIKPMAERFVAAAGWSGLFMFELLRDDQGTLWFIEFNGRAWGSLALSRRHGLEYPAWAVNPSANVPMTAPRNGTVVCRNLGRELVHLLFVLRGPKAKNIEWPSFWRTAVDMLRVRRNQSFYNWRTDDWRVFFSDGWNTIKEQVFK